MRSSAPGPGPSDEATASDSPAAGQLVPVYDLGETPAGTRLFREFRREPGVAGGMDDALAALSAIPDDPDYRTLWPRDAFQGGFVDYEGGGRFSCELTDVDPNAVAIGDRLEMTFRRLFTAQGVHNYFWKARPGR